MLSGSTRLEPFAPFFKARYAKYLKWVQTIDQTEGGIDNFSRGWQGDNGLVSTHLICLDGSAHSEGGLPSLEGRLIRCLTDGEGGDGRSPEPVGWGSGTRSAAASPERQQHTATQTVVAARSSTPAIERAPPCPPLSSLEASSCGQGAKSGPGVSSKLEPPPCPAATPSSPPWRASSQSPPRAFH